MLYLGRYLNAPDPILNRVGGESEAPKTSARMHGFIPVWAPRGERASPRQASR